MGRGARKELGREMKAESAAERARRGRYAGALETEAGRYLRGEHTPEVVAAGNVWTAMQEQQRRRVAATGQRAGYGATALEMGREKERAITRATKRGRTTGARILQGLYGPSTQYQASLYGTRAGLAQTPSFWERFLPALVGGAGEAAGAYYGAKGQKT